MTADTLASWRAWIHERWAESSVDSRVTTLALPIDGSPERQSPAESRAGDKAEVTSLSQPRPWGSFHADLGTTSTYLQGIDPSEIIDAVRSRRQPTISATAGLTL